MRRTTIVAVLILLALAGCSRETSSGRSINPLTWFDARDLPDTLVPVEQRLSTDNRLLVQQITDISIEATPGGVIIVATGLPPTQGYWQTDLVLDRPSGDPLQGVLTYQFRIAPPLSGLPQQQNTTRTDSFQTESGVNVATGFSFGPGGPQQQQPSQVSRPAGTPQSRQVTAAVFLTAQQLENVNEVRIIAERNARTLRR